MAAGGTIARVCEANGISSGSLYRQLRKVPAFATEYATARAIAADALADDLLSVRDANKWPDVNRARVWADQAKWVLARQHRDKYGDRVDVGVTVTVDLGAALRDAKARALLPVRDQSRVIDAEYADVTDTCGAGRTDNESAARVAAADPATLPAPSIFD